jgi:hypothetical protein
MVVDPAKEEAMILGLIDGLMGFPESEVDVICWFVASSKADLATWVEGYVWHCGAACACQNLSLGHHGDQHLRSAERCAQHLRREKLNALHVAPLLRAIYSELGERQNARRWMVFLRHLRCARETEEAMLQRGSMMVERCQQQQERRLVIP